MKALITFALHRIPRPLLIAFSYVIKPLIPFFLRGNAVEDPIDGRKFSRFLPYGYQKIRSHALSPSTFSLERHRLLWLYLQNETEFFTRKLKLLHFAPEQAFYNRFKKLKNLEYTTTDLNSPLADIKADICALPFQDNTYDFILCNHVLEHIQDDHKAMQELYRVLTPNGMAILQVPYQRNRPQTFENQTITDPKERARVFGQYDHVRIYGEDYFDRLEKVGFKVNKIDYTANMTQTEVHRYGLEKGEIIPVCVKYCTHN